VKPESFAFRHRSLWSRREAGGHPKGRSEAEEARSALTGCRTEAIREGSSELSYDRVK
jgi:hypothetical protein